VQLSNIDATTRTLSSTTLREYQAMQNTDIISALDHAKDAHGMITPAAMHDQLQSLSAEDWKQAASLYTKGAANGNGLYIEDTDGTVTIHNDTSKATEFLNKSTLQDAVDTAKATAPTFAELMGVPAGLGAVFGIGSACEGDSFLALAAAGAGTGVAITAGIFGGLALGMVAGVAAYDYSQKQSVRQELATDATLNFSTKGHY
jgi:hypothetical protein